MIFASLCCRLSQEASNRAELEEQHQLELEAERIKNERLLSQLKSDNDSKIQSMKREADKNIQADRHQREALSAAMVEAERKRAEIERMSLMRIQNYKESVWLACFLQSKCLGRLVSDHTHTST